MKAVWIEIRDGVVRVKDAPQKQSVHICNVNTGVMGGKRACDKIDDPLVKLGVKVR